MTTRATFGSVVKYSLVYGLALALLTWWVGWRAPFTPDEGIYASQVDRLVDGSWYVDLPSVELNPDGDLDGYGGARTSDGYVHYARHPLYPVLAAVPAHLMGALPALLALSIAGAIASAAAAWRLAEALGASARLSFLIAATSPLAVSAVIGWSHTLGAAASAWAMVWLLRARARSRHIAAWAGVASCLAFAVLVRSEALLFSGAVVLVLVIEGLMSRTRRHVVSALLIGVVIAGTVAAERLWIRSIVGTAVAIEARGAGVANPDLGFLGQRWNGFAHAVLGGSHYDADLELVAWIAATTVAAGAIGIAWRKGASVGAASVAAGTALLAARVLVDPVDPIPGLLIAWPAAAVFILVRRTSASGWIVVATGATFFVAVVATQYADGGALQWGGRFFIAVIPLLAPLLATVAEQRSLRLALVGSAAVVALVGAFSVGRTRAEHDRAVDAIRRHDVELSLTPFSVLPQSMWDDQDRVWLSPSLDEVPEALAVARDHEIRDVLLVWPHELAVPSPAGWEVVDEGTIGYDGFGFRLLRLSPT